MSDDFVAAQPGEAPDPILEYDDEDPLMDPRPCDLFAERMNALPRLDGDTHHSIDQWNTGEMGPDRLERQVERGRRCPPLSTRQHEHTQLHRAGSHTRLRSMDGSTVTVSVVLPECRWGAQCISRELPCAAVREPRSLVPSTETSSLVLQQYYTQDEWQHVLETGKAPDRKRDCLMDYRFRATLVSIHAAGRNLRLTDVEDDLQAFRNTTDAETGYPSYMFLDPLFQEALRDHELVRADGHQQRIHRIPFGSMVEFQRHRHRWYWDSGLDAFCVEQDLQPDGAGAGAPADPDSLWLSQAASNTFTPLAVAEDAKVPTEVEEPPAKKKKRGGVTESSPSSSSSSPPSEPSQRLFQSGAAPVPRPPRGGAASPGTERSTIRASSCSAWPRTMA